MGAPARARAGAAVTAAATRRPPGHLLRGRVDGRPPQRGEGLLGVALVGDERGGVALGLVEEGHHLVGREAAERDHRADERLQHGLLDNEQGYHVLRMHCLLQGSALPESLRRGPARDSHRARRCRVTADRRVHILAAAAGTDRSVACRCRSAWRRCAPPRRGPARTSGTWSSPSSSSAPSRSPSGCARGPLDRPNDALAHAYRLLARLTEELARAAGAL